MSACWDGMPIPPRDEDGWQDSDDGDMPWAPNPAEAGDWWKPTDWSKGPEEKMWRDKLDEEDTEC